MTLPSPVSTSRPLRIVDHMVLIAVAALPLSAGARASSTHASLAVLFSLVILLEAHMLWWLLVQGGPERGGWLDRIALPAFVAVSLVYLALSFLTYFSRPDAAVHFVGSQLVLLIYIGLRS